MPSRASQQNSWIAVDLIKYAVIPDYYRFCNTRHTNCMPRSWRFQVLLLPCVRRSVAEAAAACVWQGSRDGNTWTTLREHTSDYTLSAGVNVRVLVLGWLLMMFSRVLLCRRPRGQSRTRRPRRSDISASSSRA